MYMKAAVIYEAGGPQQLKIRQVPVPSVKEGWSLIKIKGFGLNHSEIFTRKGLSPTVSFPRILGIECTGTIAESTDPFRLPTGTKVISFMGEMGRAFDGSYAEYTLLPNQQIYPVSSNLPWPDLAAIPESCYTAFGALKSLRIQADSSILVRGGTSGVGLAFLKLIKAKFPHIHISGTSRTKEKASLLTSLGYDTGLVDDDGRLSAKGQSFDRILELIGPRTIKDSFRYMSDGGILCSVGQLGNQWYLENFDPITDIPSGAYLSSFYSGNVNAGKIQEMFDYIKQYNIIFLDINMDDVDGIVTAQKIREYSSEIYIVFVTAYINYSLEGYKVEAIRYLLKNNTNLEASISECMDAILHKMNLVVKKKKFKFNEGEKEINIDNILYIESKLHKLQFYIMEDKIKIYNLYGTLNELENELKDFHFIRIHQSYLTNLKYIRSVKCYKVLLCNNQELLIPKARYKNVKDAFISYKGEL